MKANELLQIGEIFRKQGWPINRDMSSQFPDAFERFCRMCSRLDQAQRKLIFEITPSYLWILRHQDQDLFLKAWDEFLKYVPPDAASINVLPLIKPGSSHPKSADAIWYNMAKGFEANLRIGVSPRNLRIMKKAGDFGRKYAGPRTTLVLIDDYVGSGDSAIKMIKHLQSKYPQMLETKLFVLALAAQKQAAIQFATHKVTLITNFVLPRGISENPNLTNISEALDVMDKIGRKLGIPKKDRLGYEKTEALLTLTRTPNNTFPIYWTNRKVDGEVWDSPFTRFTDYEH